MKTIADQKMNLPTRAPLMVLPGAQLFPHALLPLYIFEPRYRAMLSWSLEQDRMFCIAPMKPGVEEVRTNDDFHHLVGLGLVRACVGREDGTSHLVLQGVARVRITGMFQDTPFRIAEVREVADDPADSVEAEKLAAQLLETCTQLRAQGGVPQALDPQLLQLEDLGILTDVLAHALLRTPEERQAVLEKLNVAERSCLLNRLLRAHLSADDED